MYTQCATFWHYFFLVLFTLLVGGKGYMEMLSNIMTLREEHAKNLITLS